YLRFEAAGGPAGASGSSLRDGATCGVRPPRRAAALPGARATSDTAPASASAPPTAPHLSEIREPGIRFRNDCGRRPWRALGRHRCRERRASDERTLLSP